MPITDKRRGIKLFWFSIINTIKGFKVTIINLFRRPITVQYPDEKLKVSDRFRGILENDVSQCIICMACARACPVDCIEIDFQKEDGKRKLVKYDIHIYKCLFCGLCIEACPKGCLTMTKNYEFAQYDKKNLIINCCKNNKPS
jgi:NAD(P)H-quinone oxidoreductase subunit I